MILYTTIPGVVNNLISRLKTEAAADSQPGLVNLLTDIGTVTWFNLPYNLNKLVLGIKGYQAILVDGDLQDLIDEIGTIYWFDLFNKVNLLIKATELIESLT
jgi:hypothetical protein